jgi:hypothetical protein
MRKKSAVATAVIRIRRPLMRRSIRHYRLIRRASVASIGYKPVVPINFRSSVEEAAFIALAVVKNGLDFVNCKTSWQCFRIHLSMKYRLLAQ